ncbi:MAG: hypothetical protein BSR46_05290 [Candidatus Dactylopiibacterium carminicum]|nr:MAG: hypothetical protein BSR46_05290 [Candidatus Dactylopiibacterium carminicum]
MQGFFAPAIRLLNGLRYGSKFALLGALAMATVGFYVAALAQVQHYSLVAHAAEHDAAYGATLPGQAAAVARQFDALATVLQQDDRFGLAERWSALRTAWQGLPATSGEQRAQALAGIKRGLQDFVADLGAASGLLSDSERSRNLLADLLIRKLPNASGRLAALGETTVGLLVTKDVGAEWTRMAALGNSAASARADLLDALVRAGSAASADALKAQAETLAPALQGVLDSAEREVVRGAFSLSPATFINEAGAVQQSLHAAYAPLREVLDQRLAARVEALEARFWYSSLIGALLVGMLCYISAALMMSIFDGVARLAEGATRIGEGELGHRIEYLARDELETVSSQFNRMAAGLATTLGSVRQSVEALQSAAESLASTADRVSDGSVRQSESAASMAASVEEMTVGVEEIARNASAADSAASESGELSVEGGKVVEHAVSEMAQIADSVNQSSAVIAELGQNSARISSIVQSIKDIADQTNLLALNAAIEAARAGEDGRGFAVVADEVRKLAERTTSATKEIAGMVGAIQAGTGRAVTAMQGGVLRVQEGLELTRRSGAAMNGIREESSRVLHSVSEISQALREQSSACTDIARHVEAVAQMAEENNAVIGQARDTARTLVTLAEELTREVRRFRL